MTPDELNALPRPLAFVLPGGGALGSYQVGVLRALTDAGVAPDMLIGVSAGAVNASLFAWHQGVDGIRRLEGIWRGIRRRDLLRLQPGRMAMAMAGRHPSFLDNRHGAEFLRRHLGGRLLEHSPVRLVLVATDLSTRRGRRPHRTATPSPRSSPAPRSPACTRPCTSRAARSSTVAWWPTCRSTSRSSSAQPARWCCRCRRWPPTTRRTNALEILFRSSSLGVEAHGRTVLRRPPPGLHVAEIPRRAVVADDVRRRQDRRR